jgi:two-component system response regulator NreC
MARIRILLADDHAVLRSGLRMLIGSQRDLEVVGEASDGDEAVRKAAVLRPDVALVDITMPGS